MTHATPSTAAERPPVNLIDHECDTLIALALQIEPAQPVLANLLLDEMYRAELHSAADLPAHTVTMNAIVEFVDEATGKSRVVQLVYPQQADIAEGRISILTPIGAGLIGLSRGDTIAWPDRDGQDHRLRIIDVRMPDADAPQ